MTPVLFPVAIRLAQPHASVSQLKEVAADAGRKLLTRVLELVPDHAEELAALVDSYAQALTLALPITLATLTALDRQDIKAYFLGQGDPARGMRR